MSTEQATTNSWRDAIRAELRTKSKTGPGTNDRRHPIDIRTWVLVYSTTNTVCKHDSKIGEVILVYLLTNAIIRTTSPDYS